MIRLTVLKNGQVVESDLNFSNMDELSRELMDTASVTYISTVMDHLGRGETEFSIENGTYTDHYQVIS